MPNMVLMRGGVRRFTGFRIALISEFPVAINGMIATPPQFFADRSLASAGNAFNQIISHAHGQMIHNMSDNAGACDSTVT